MFAPATPRTRCRDTRYGLAKRTVNLLEENGAATLNDAAARTADEMLAWPAFGQTCLNDVKEALRRVGLRLRTTADSDPTPVYDKLDLSVRARRGLRALDIETIGQLLSVPRSELLAIKNFGRVSLRRSTSSWRWPGSDPWG